MATESFDKLFVVPGDKVEEFVKNCSARAKPCRSESEMLEDQRRGREWASVLLKTWGQSR